MNTTAASRAFISQDDAHALLALAKGIISAWDGPSGAAPAIEAARSFITSLDRPIPKHAAGPTATDLAQMLRLMVDAQRRAETPYALDGLADTAEAMLAKFNESK